VNDSPDRTCPRRPARSARAVWKPPIPRRSGGSRTAGRRSPTPAARSCCSAPSTTAASPTWAQLRSRRVVDLWAERTTAQGARDDVDYVLIFENRGAEVGATIEHPHGQLYALDRVPALALDELRPATCPICAELARGLCVTTHGGWSAVVPHAASWPYELHRPDRSRRRSPDPRRRGVRRLGRRPRRRALPAVRRPDAVHVLGPSAADRRRRLAAVARAHRGGATVPPGRRPALRRGRRARSGVYFNPLVPEDAAAELRALRPTTG